jgi:predicted dehydrogenase/sugar phosphate isomerase/epimerase
MNKKQNTSPFGVSSIIFHDFPLQKALERLSRTPFERVDLAIILPSFCPHYDPLHTDAEDDTSLKELFQQYGLSASTLNVVPGYFNKDDPQVVSAFIRRCVAAAAKLGAHSVTVPSGAKPDEKDWLLHVDRVCEPLREEARYAADHGIVLSIEAPHKGTLVETIQQAENFFDRLDSELLRCTFDTSHILLGERNSLEQGLEAVGLDRINHIHLRDTIGEDISLTPGKGRGRFKGFFQRMKESSYQGDYIFELEYEDYSEKERYRELDFAFQYCHALYSKGKLPPRLWWQSTGFFQTAARFARNPKSEVKRHKRLLRAARKVYPFFLGLKPDDVYEGRWKKKYRLGKKRVVRHKPQSITVQQKPEKTYCIGIVGCGWAGMQMHGPGFERLNNTRIVGGFDLDKGKTEAFARRFGCEPYRSLEDLVQKSRPDIVAVCSKEWSHYEQAKYLLSSGVDVFCEKLMATRLSHAQEMVELARKHKRVLGVNYNYRFIPGVRKIKQAIEQKVLGDISYFVINVHAMSYAHILDLLSFLGGRIKTVSGFIKNDDSLRPFANMDWSLYDKEILYVPSIYASVTCEFEEGFIGVVNSSYFYELEAMAFTVDAVFRNGAVTLNGINMFDIMGDLSFISREKIRKIDMNHKKGVFAKGFEYTFYRSIESFVRNYTAGEPPETPGEQGLFNMRLEQAISRSNAKKAKVSLDYLYSRR